MLNTKEFKKMSFSQLVDSISAEELRQFILNYATESTAFKQSFQVYFAEKNPTGGKENYLKLIEKGLNSGMDQHGFIDYYQAPKAFKTVFELLDKAQEFLNHKNYNETWQIASAVIEKIGDLTDVDDSDGLIVDSFEGAFNLISYLTENEEVPMLLKNQMFDWHLTEYPKPSYQNYGDDILLDSMVNLAEATQRMNEVFPLLDKKITISRSDYELTGLLKKKAALLKASGRIAEMVQLIHENLRLPEFRQMKVAELLEQKWFDEAIELIKEGILISEKLQNSGTTIDWKKQLLDIFQQTKQHDKYLILLRELFYVSRSEKKRYYQLLKKTIQPEEWATERDSIISRLKKVQRTDPFLYELYVIEQMWDELLSLIKQSFNYSLLKQYDQFLFGKYPEDILKMHTIVCQKFAEQSNSRSNYQELATMMKYVQKFDGGKQIVAQLLVNFRTIYKRRPAMMDELAKVK
jgi:L-rhamnose mutarotase